MKKQIEIIIPNHWSEVSLKHYQNYVDEVSGVENEDEIVVKTISSLCGVSNELVKRLKINDIKDIYHKLSELITKPVNKNIFDKIKIKDIMYGFHPNLDEMSLGEFVDLEENCKGGVGNLHNVLAILYRPITEEKGKEYNIEPYSENHIKNAPLFQDLSIDVVNGVMLFFYTLGTKCLMNLSNYLEQNLPNKIQEVITDGSPS